MVTQKNFSMKNVLICLSQAAKLAGISYSTAKKIFTHFRITLKTNITKRSTEQDINTNAPRALFRNATPLEARRVAICCLIGGISQEAWRHWDEDRVHKKVFRSSSKLTQRLHLSCCARKWPMILNNWNFLWSGVRISFFTYITKNNNARFLTYNWLFKYLLNFYYVIWGVSTISLTSIILINMHNRVWNWIKYSWKWLKIVS